MILYILRNVMPHNDIDADLKYSNERIIYIYCFVKHLFSIN